MRISAGLIASRLPRVLLLSTFALGIVFAQETSVRPLIVQPLDESKLTVLKGNVHPMAQLQFDQGAAPASLPMDRMLLVLKRSAEQETELRKMVDDQQDKSSPNFHKWLTPEQFGHQFGPADNDILTVTTWLRSHGFQIGQVSKGRTVIEFSGTAAQIQEALHTSIHKYLVDGEERWANAGDPQVPSALEPVVAGFDSLNNFQKKAQNSFAGTFTRLEDSGKLVPQSPQFTFPGGCTPDGNCYAIVPYDFATIYNVLPLWNAGIDGTGQTIAIVGRTNINPQDSVNFRASFGLPENPPNIIVNGPDPGITGDESEADIDVQWSGAVAKNATIDFVTSASTATTDGVDLSALYIVDNNLAPVMSESYGQCELGLGTGGNQFYGALWEQAAAQGISVFVSTGDNGAAGCDNPNGVAQYGLNVNGLSSTQFNAAVGGTDFNELNKYSTYWGPVNDPTTQESALSYIPETTWDDSCTNPLLATLTGGSTHAEANCNNPSFRNFLDSEGGSGGVSHCVVNSQQLGSCTAGYAKPSWQSGNGVPNDSLRDTPDISLFASNGFLGTFYVVCQQSVAGFCSVNQFAGYGGTSVASPAFAGIMALVNQKMAQLDGTSQAPQGVPGFVLYKLAASKPSAFHDVPAGTTIAMPCKAGTQNCTVNTAGHSYGVLSGYNTATGYDLATGLGSVDVNNLVNNWNTVVFTASATSLSLNSGTAVNITHGQAVNVHIGVTPAAAGGDASLMVSTGSGTSDGKIIDLFHLTGGAATGTTGMLPGGTYNVVAHYAGSGVYGGSYSAPVSVTVGKENSSVNFPGVLTGADNSGDPVYATTVTYGASYALRADVLNSAGAFCNPLPLGKIACPSGNMTFTDNGNALGTGSYPINDVGYAQTQSIQLGGGAHLLAAQYAGDPSFKPGAASVSVTVMPASTSMVAPYSFQILAGEPTVMNVQVNAGAGVAPSGTVKFYANGAILNGTVTYLPRDGSLQVPGSLYASLATSDGFALPGTYVITSDYSGDSNYSASASPSTTVTIRFRQPQFIFKASNYSAAPGETLTFTATVLTNNKSTAPTGTVVFSNTAGQLPGTVTYSNVTDHGNLNLKATVDFTADAVDNFTAVYSGDANYPGNQTGSGVITVAGNDFTLVPTAPSLTVFPGQYAQEPFVVGLQSDSLLVTFSQTACTGLPAEATCTSSMYDVNRTMMVQFFVNTTARHAVASLTPPDGPFKGRSGWIPAMGGLLVGMVLMSSPFGKRRGSKLLSVAVLACLIMLPGCGGTSSPGTGGGGGGGGGHTDPGTPAGSYPITVTATSGTITHTATFTLVVQ